MIIASAIEDAKERAALLMTFIDAASEAPDQEMPELYKSDGPYLTWDGFFMTVETPHVKAHIWADVRDGRLEFRVATSFVEDEDSYRLDESRIKTMREAIIAAYRLIGEREDSNTEEESDVQDDTTD